MPAIVKAAFLSLIFAVIAVMVWRMNRE